MSSSFDSALSLLSSWRNSSSKLCVFFRNNNDGWRVSTVGFLKDVSQEEDDNKESWFKLEFESASFDFKKQHCEFSIFDPNVVPEGVSFPSTAPAIESVGFISSKGMHVVVSGKSF